MGKMNNGQKATPKAVVLYLKDVEAQCEQAQSLIKKAKGLKG